MHLPNQAAPVSRSHRGTSACSTPAVSLRASAPTNTCACNGDCLYNKPEVYRNDCIEGFYPECDCGTYNSSCSCVPI